LGRATSRWADVALPALLILLVSAPIMAVEEDWHGSPMIDQPSHLWVIPAGIVAAAFFVGGAVAGHRRPSAPAFYASAAAVLAVTVLLVADVSRRIWLAHEGAAPGAVARLWGFGVVAALMMGAVGSLLGRRLTTDTSG